MSTGDYLRAFRDEHDLTKAQLAARLNSKLRTVEDWEAGRRSPPDMLPLALSAVALKISPWTASKKLEPNMPWEDVREAADWLFSSKAQDQAADSVDAFERCVPSESRPSQALLFAHLLTGNDGYNSILGIEKWEDRATSGKHPAMVFHPDLGGATPTIALETRSEGEFRQLAVFVDTHRPGERSPAKLRVETALHARGIRVMSFSEAEIFYDSEDCRARVENALSELIEECWIKLGHIPRHIRQRDDE